MSASAAPSIAVPLRALVDAYLRVLANERGASAHTLRAYQRELARFAAWAPNGSAKRSRSGNVRVDQIEHTDIRAYLGTLYERGLSKASAARALAAIRSWFKWLARTGHIEQNAARWWPRRAAQASAARALHRADEPRGGFGGDDAASWPARDRAILEMLYGCGIRNAELTGLNLDDIHWANEAILVRGKGQEAALRAAGRRGGAGAAALSGGAVGAAGRGRRGKANATPALFMNLQLRGLGKGGQARLTTRSVGRIVKRIAILRGLLFRRASAHAAPRLRHSFAGRRAPICAPFRSCLATSGSRPRSATRS
jgi:integrase/recombinase XerC